LALETLANTGNDREKDLMIKGGLQQSGWVAEWFDRKVAEVGSELDKREVDEFDTSML
jgi:hypothetical protein